MKLKMKEIIQVQNGLNLLDGYQKVVKKDGADTAVLELYKLGGVVRLKIAKNQNRTRDVIETYREAVNKLISDLSNGGQTVPPDKVAEFQKQQAEMFAVEEEIAVTQLTVAELNLEENPIPASVLALLEPILEGVN